MAALRSCFFCVVHVPGEMDALRGSKTLGISLELSEISRLPELRVHRLTSTMPFTPNSLVTPQCT